MGKLTRHGLFGCGTIRENEKHFPKEKLLEDKLLQMSQFDFAVKIPLQSGKVGAPRLLRFAVICITLLSVVEFLELMRQEKGEILYVHNQLWPQ
ncbi:hypothetical protein JTB14_030330 [Gonioctena quinquepunctata]|nr:hypothetical protein JTB14_030330 [Gonioctena quinquepunctata]